METIMAKQMEKVAEQEVISWLENNNFFRVTTTNYRGNYHYLRAEGTENPILVIIKISHYPETPQLPSENELKDIKLHSEKEGREAWVAKIQVDDQGHPVGDIEWQNLTRRGFKV